MSIVYHKASGTSTAPVSYVTEGAASTGTITMQLNDWVTYDRPSTWGGWTSWDYDQETGSRKMRCDCSISHLGYPQDATIEVDFANIAASDSTSFTCDNWVVTRPPKITWRRSGTTGSCAYTLYETYESPKVTKRDSLKKMLKRRLFPAIHTSVKPPGHSEDIRETRARETLRRVIGDQAYQRFLVKGNVCIRAKSGLVYQIWPGHGQTKVYKEGKCIERMCVVLAGDFPPTDSLIARFIIIVNNEDLFRSKANISLVHMHDGLRIRNEPQSLIEEARSLGLVG